MAKPGAQGVTTLTEAIGGAVSQVRRRMWDAASKTLASAGETTFSWQALSFLDLHERLSQKDLIRMSLQHPAIVSRVLDELERRGLARRDRDPADRRRCIVALTPAGRRHCRALRPRVVADCEPVLGPLSEAERHQLRDLLRRILAPFDAD
jgi:DNA-binding MarR family transcriptional regulator